MPVPLNFSSRKQTRYRLYWSLGRPQAPSGLLFRIDNHFHPPGFDEMGGACGPYGGRERSVQGAGGETRGEEAAGETKA